MRPSRWPTLLSLVLVAGAVGWVVAEVAWDDLVALPAAAPITAVVIALFEGALARVVARKVKGLSPGKPMHPLQVARAAVLAKASSATGALLTGFYGGFFLWVVRLNDKQAARQDAWVAGWSTVACLALLVAALLLERACRTPASRDEMAP